MMNSTHKEGEIIFVKWEYVGIKRPVKRNELYESYGHVCIARGCIDKPHEILHERKGR